MNVWLNITLPFKEPIIVFTIILVIFLFFPLLFRRMKIPGIIGLLFAGIVLGPHGFNLISKDIGITLFGTVGLLYLMFLTGLEINIRDFKKYKSHSILFGVFVFSIPLLLGFLVTRYCFQMPFLSALLFSSIFSTTTLISYPIISQYGLTDKKITGIIIGGIIISDTAVLILLTIVSSATKGDLDILFWGKFILRFTVFLGIVIVVLPRAGKWLLSRLQGESGYQYISVLMMVFLASLSAELLEIEPILGAFISGLALNKLIPKTSPLMNRIVFIGNSLFIPFFLISVGMLINISALFSGYNVLYFSAGIIVVDFSAKFISTYITQKLFGYTKTERNLMFGLSVSHAATSIAIILVGYGLGLFDENIMNSAILLILASCLVSSFITEKAAHTLSHDQKYVEIPDPEVLPERILVPLSNPNTFRYLMNFALAIKSTAVKEPLYPLAVIPEDKDTAVKIMEFNQSLRKFQMEAAATENTIEPLVRLDVSVVGGIERAAKEMMISKIIIGWNGKVSASNFILGTLLQNLVRKANQMLLVIKIDKPMEYFGSIKIFVPPEAEYEYGYLDWIHTIVVLSNRVKRSPEFFGSSKTLGHIRKVLKNKSGTVSDPKFRNFDAWKSFYRLPSTLSATDLIIVITARHRSASHHAYLDHLPRILTRFFNHLCFVLVYPSIPELEYETLNIKLGN